MGVAIFAVRSAEHTLPLFERTLESSSQVAVRWIVVLVFALAQGLFAAVVAATFAMALGTAATTGALAWTAVFAKSAAMRLAAGENSRLALVARGFEFAAALAVLGLGVALMFGARGAA